MPDEIVPVKTVEEAAAVVHAEYEYWKNAPEAVALQAMGAIGATANIYAALQGFRAPWHPQPSQELQAENDKSEFLHHDFEISECAKVQEELIRSGKLKIKP